MRRMLFIELVVCKVLSVLRTACSPHKRPVPFRGWKTPVRVCTMCFTQCQEDDFDPLDALVTPLHDVDDGDGWEGDSSTEVSSTSHPKTTRLLHC